MRSDILFFGKVVANLVNILYNYVTEVYASEKIIYYWRRLTMKKRILSVLTSVAVLGSMACASAVSTSAFSGTITFEINDNWAAANKTFYAHIWNGLPDGAALYGWQTKDEKMTIAEDGKTATYEVPEGDWNLIIISGDSGIQTYDTVFNASCIGDTCYVMDEQFENPVDSKKKAYGLGWKNNADCGPHKVVSSLGNVIGTAYLPGENDQNLYDNFVKKYNPQNGIDGIVDGETYLCWDDDGKVETGMDWEEAKAHVAQQLGVTVESSSDASSSDASSSDASSSNASSSNTTTTTSSSRTTTTSSSSSQSTGTTTTGDSTPIVALVATLTASLGVAFFARKKAVK